jgi:hypothetical protein
MDTTSEVVGQIYSTKNYDLFKHNPINRGKGKIEEVNVLKLMERMKRRNFLPEIPLLVWEDPKDGTYTIIKGHHRYEAAKRLGLPINYQKTILPDTRPEDAPEMELGQTLWTTQNHIDAYVARGNLEYKKLMEFLQGHEIDFSLFLKMANCNKKTADKIRSLKQAQFIWRDSFYDLVPAIKNMHKLIEGFQNLGRNKIALRNINTKFAFFYFSTNPKVDMEKFIENLPLFNKEDIKLEKYSWKVVLRCLIKAHNLKTKDKKALIDDSEFPMLK